MAGLLKSIQKKSGGSAQQRGEREGFLTLVGENTTIVDRRKSEAEQLLSDLIQESGELTPRLPDAAPATATRVVKRHQINRGEESSIEPKENSLPDWAKPQSKLPANLENLLAEVVKRTILIVQECNCLPRDREAVFRRALTEISTEQSAEAKISWKDQDLIERELKNLTSFEYILGPIITDEWTTEIYCDSHKSIKVRRKGQLIETPLNFRSVNEYELFCAALFTDIGKILSSTNPILECGVQSGPNGAALINGLHRSIVGDSENHLTIKLPRLQSASFYDLLQQKILPATVAAWLAEVVSQGEINILVIGPKCSGRNLIVGALASEIGSHERVIVIENIPEIQFSGPNMERLVASGSSLSGNIDTANLIANAARRHPSRIISSNLRDKAAFEYLRALESGLSGCIASINGEFPEDGLWKVLDEVSIADNSKSENLMRRIVRSFQLVISLHQYDGKPCMVEVAEVLPVEEGEFRVLPLVQLESIKEGKRIWKITAADSYLLRKVAERGGGLRSGPGVLPYGDSGGTK
jgi:Flp pilus assembly CpaF family ATPase